MPDSVIPLLVKPGYKRDGTVIDGDYCTDGQWNRFNNFGRPRKMGGYRLIAQNGHGPIYGMNIQTANGTAYIFQGSASYLEMQPMSMVGVPGGLSDRTPAALASDANRIWTLDSIYDLTSSKQKVLAHANSSLSDIDNSTASHLYYGDLTAGTALTATSAPQVSGGVCVLHPFTFVYGDDGYVAWSDVGTPDVWTGGASGDARVTESKIVYGTNVRGGAGVAPAGLFWSLNSLVRATFAGGTAQFNFDTITDQSSIMSSRGVIEMDGVFYWPGVDRFLMYNGVVTEIPNQMNFYWFFDNIDLAKRQFLWATKVPRHGEIWWFFARGTSSVADYAIIYNVRLQTWYDTVLPEGGRSDGYFAQVFPYPVWAGIVPNSLSKYPLWQHELYNSYDKTTGSNIDAVQANFTTPDLNLLAQSRTNNIVLKRIEPDFQMDGDMSVQTLSRPFPQSPDKMGPEDPCTFGPNTTRIDAIRTQGRYMRVKFESNVAGGFYEMGETIAEIDVGDERPMNAGTTKDG